MGGRGGRRHDHLSIDPFRQRVLVAPLEELCIAHSSGSRKILCVHGRSFPGCGWEDGPDNVPPNGCRPGAGASSIMLGVAGVVLRADAPPKQAAAKARDLPALEASTGRTARSPRAPPVARHLLPARPDLESSESCHTGDSRRPPHSMVLLFCRNAERRVSGGGPLPAISSLGVVWLPAGCLRGE